jgi:hypothetical protein
MIRILLACESGTGLGHVDNLRTFAKALGPAFSFDGCHYLDRTLETLRPVCDDVFRCPAMFSRKGVLPSAAEERHLGWGNYLANCGFSKPLVIAQRLLWWRQCILMRQIDMVIADYAPHALLAARTLGVATVATGTCYSVPPAGLSRFPAFLDPSVPTSVDEAAMVRAVNAVCAVRGMAPIRTLPEMYDCDVRLPRGLTFLDPYQAVRQEHLLPRPDTPSRLMAGAGSEIFVYLSNNADDPDYMLEALADLGAPVRLFVPWLDDTRKAALAARGIMVEDKPLTADDIARRTRLMVLYGQPSTTALGLASGIPLVAFPQHIEQFVHAERAARTGALRLVRREDLTREVFVETIRTAYRDENLWQAAQRLAPAVRAELAVDVPDMIRESLRPVLVEIVKRKGLA